MNKQFHAALRRALRSRHAAGGQIQPHRESRFEFHGHGSGRGHARRRGNVQWHLPARAGPRRLRELGAAHRLRLAAAIHQAEDRRFAAAIRFSTTKRFTIRWRRNILAYEPPFATSENLITSGTQVLTLENGFPSISTISNRGGVNPFYKDGYAQIWTLGTETSFSQNWILDLTYTGTKGTDLDLLRAPNRAPLGTSPLDTQDSLQIPVRQQLLLRSIRREFDLQRAAGAPGAPLHARPFVASVLHFFEIAR